MDEPGFVCVEANVVDAQGARVKKKHRWEPRVFFMGGAAVAPEALRPGTEPADYDDFWNAQMAALDAVPIEPELTPTPCADAGVRRYAVRIACSRQALMAASLVPHATKITTGVTWGCDWTGQNEYGRLPSGYRPKCWFPDMAYFDAVFAARRVRCPVEIKTAGLGNYVSPPSSLAVLYNALNVPKKITWCQGWTHGWNPDGMAKWTEDGGFSETNVRQP